ncbi:hypothetical protein OHS70_23875 [Streptomyces sp. NBC_00390]|uniref:hypothetical protein n=1 Tax=Streptomyces sp. NBC_00390 TaxID=2975736 RepID=UPI002E227E1B
MLFLDRYVEILRSAGRRHPATPHQALEEWSDFVEYCREGYGSTIFEYWDDISIRSFLQSIVDDVVVRETSESVWFLAEVYRIDEQFKTVLADGFNVTGGRGWWERRIPRIGGEELARTVSEQYGFEMEVV